MIFPRCSGGIHLSPCFQNFSGMKYSITFVIVDLSTRNCPDRRMHELLERYMAPSGPNRIRCSKRRATWSYVFGIR
jgi:hypothetical protein